MGLGGFVVLFFPLGADAVSHLQETVARRLLGQYDKVVLVGRHLHQARIGLGHFRARISIDQFGADVRAGAVLGNEQLALDHFLAPFGQHDRPGRLKSEIRVPQLGGLLAIVDEHGRSATDEIVVVGLHALDRGGPMARLH